MEVVQQVHGPVEITKAMATMEIMETVSVLQKYLMLQEDFNQQASLIIHTSKTKLSLNLQYQK